MADQLTEDQKKIIKIIVDEAKKQGIDPEFAVSLANLESGFKHIPANDKESTSFGPFQVNKGTAQANNIDYDEMVKNPELATRAGVINLARHAKNPLFEGDPARIAAAHRYGENSEFAKTGDLESLKKDPVLRSYLTDLADHFEGAQLPESIYKEPEVEKKAEEKHTEANKENAPISTFPQPQIEIPRGVAGGVGAIGGAGAGALLGTKAALLRSKYDIAQLISAYPDAKAAFMAGKSPAEVASIALKHVTPSAQVSATTPASTLPDAQGPLTGNPAGGYQTQNWVASGDTQGRYTDVGLNARDKAEAHQMKLKAMEAEDKIRKIAPEFAPIFDILWHSQFPPRRAGSLNWPSEDRISRDPRRPQNLRKGRSRCHCHHWWRHPPSKGRCCWWGACPTSGSCRSKVISERLRRS